MCQSDCRRPAVSRASVTGERSGDTPVAGSRQEIPSQGRRPRSTPMAFGISVMPASVSVTSIAGSHERSPVCIPLPARTGSRWSAAQLRAQLLAGRTGIVSQRIARKLQSKSPVRASIRRSGLHLQVGFRKSWIPTVSMYPSDRHSVTTLNCKGGGFPFSSLDPRKLIFQYTHVIKRISNCLNCFRKLPGADLHKEVSIILACFISITGPQFGRHKGSNKRILNPHDVLFRILTGIRAMWNRHNKKHAAFVDMIIRWQLRLPAILFLVRI